MPRLAAGSLLALAIPTLVCAGCRCDRRHRQSTSSPRTDPIHLNAAPAAHSPDAAVSRRPAREPRRDAGAGAESPDASPAPAAHRPDTSPPTPRHPGLRLLGARVDISVFQIDVRLLLRRLAELTATNLVLFDDVQGQVTVQMQDVPVSRALEVVARAVGCQVTVHGRMVLIRALPPR